MGLAAGCQAAFTRKGIAHGPIEDKVGRPGRPGHPQRPTPPVTPEEPQIVITAQKDAPTNGCIPQSAGPVYIDQSYGFDVGLIVGAGISFSHFKIPSTGDSGWVASGSFLGGAGLSLGGSVGVVDNLGGLLGTGLRMGVVSPIPGVGAEWSFGDNGKVNGVSGGSALGAGIFGGKTKTKLQSATRPPC